MILRYLTISIIQVILMLVQFCFSWLIALSVTKDGHLRLLPSLFEPTDSLAIGDSDYWNNEMSYCMDWTISIRNYWLALNWGMRNPAYGFANIAGFDLQNYADYKLTGNPNIDVGWAGATIGSMLKTLTNGDGKKYFEYRKVWRWNSSYVCYLQLGWSLSNLEAGRKHLCVYIRPFVKG